MGRGVYGRCYAPEGSDVSGVLEAVRTVEGKSLFAPMTEAISVLTEQLATFVPAISGYQPVAVCRAKISVSINPRLAIAVFVVRMKSLSRLAGPNVRIVVDDESGDVAALEDVTNAQIASMFALSVIEAPLHLVFWLILRLM